MKHAQQQQQQQNLVILHNNFKHVMYVLLLLITKLWNICYMQLVQLCLYNDFWVLSIVTKPLGQANYTIDELAHNTYSLEN